MRESKKAGKAKWIVLSLSLIVLSLEILKRTTSFADFYGYHIYPYLAKTMHALSSLIPVSLYDLFVTLILIIILVVIYLLIKRAWNRALFLFLGLLLSVFLFFQLSWGLNYFKSDFFHRNQISYPQNDSIVFKKFATLFIDSLNKNFPYQFHVDTLLVLTEAEKGYQNLSDKFNYINVRGEVFSKRMIYNKFYSSVGVYGYYGPFFAEVHVNADLKKHQYPAVLTHEIAHLNGITSEAEANLYAYLICSKSIDSTSRFSGYYSIFPYVISNARSFLSEYDYKQLIDQINPRILDLYKNTHSYWDSLYSPQIGKIQNVIYDIYLKNNNIPSGKKNYSEVISMILSVDSIYPIP